MITIAKSGNTVTFTFDDNSHYLYDGKIEVPVNSLSLVIDSSDMATFKKSATNDIFFSATYSELGMTKDELIAFYKNNMVDTITEDEIDGMITSATSGYADYVEYDPNSKYVNFYHGGSGGTVVFSYDASAFVIDGMIDSVEIKDVVISGETVTCLVISFNTDSGKQDINIPLSDIFDPSQYYTKSETSGATEIATALSGKQDALTAGSGISISANVISSKTVELSQAEYDALVSGGTVDPTTWYIITDAQPINLNNYYTKSETSGATEISTALSGKQNTLTAGSGITISGDVISADGGGGKSIEAGRGITITTGETADTVSFDLPISGMNSTNLIYNGSGNTVSANYYTCNNVFGKDNILSSKSTNTYKSNDYNTISGNGNEININGFSTVASSNFIYGLSNKIQCDGGYVNTNVNHNFLFGNQNRLYAKSSNNVIFGLSNNVETNGTFSFLHGYNNKSYKEYQTIFGKQNSLYNAFESALGQFNNSVSASTTFGDSGNTLFSIGNGTDGNARHNAFEVRQNGDIYCSDGTNDVKLQDTITATTANTTALGGLSLVKLSQAQYDALSPNYDANTLYVITNVVN